MLEISILAAAAAVVRVAERWRQRDWQGFRFIGAAPGEMFRGFDLSEGLAAASRDTVRK